MDSIVMVSGGEGDAALDGGSGRLGAGLGGGIGDGEKDNEADEQGGDGEADELGLVDAAGVEPDEAAAHEEGGDAADGGEAFGEDLALEDFVLGEFELLGGDRFRGHRSLVLRW